MQILDSSSIKPFGEVRLVIDGGNQIIDIREAFDMAQDRGLDLVLVSDEVKPPVVRIQDFKKIEYEKKKARKNTKKIEVKEIRFMANISDHDFETKLKSIQKFLDKGNKVKISVRLKGRERETPERARAIIQRVGDSIECKMSIIPGPMAIAMLEPQK